MGSITRQAKSLSGMILGFILVAILTFFVLNFWQTHGGPVAGVGGWLFSHASGEAYSGGAATPSAPAVSAYSQSNNLGPQL
jgi:hypothetical protein